jgi:origin recognition complex subunit 5
MLFYISYYLHLYGKSQIFANDTQPTFPSPSNLVVHGLEATGKSSITKSILETLDVRHAVVDSKECITGRHLLEKAAVSSRENAKELNSEVESLVNSRCENLSALSAQLEQLLQNQDKFVLVFDGIDRQKEAPPTLIPALARMAAAVRMISMQVFSVFN